MSQAFVRIAGHGIRLLPRVPFAIRALDAALEVVIPDEAGDFTERVGGTTERKQHRYGDVFDGPTNAPWQLEVGGVYAADWPSELALVSWPEPNEPPFFMLSDDAGALVYVQGPYAAGSAPEIATMRGAGQREVGRGSEGVVQWIDLSYEHRGAAWRQRHVVAPVGTRLVAVVTAQMPAPSAPSICALAVGFAASIVPYQA